MRKKFLLAFVLIACLFTCNINVVNCAYAADLGPTAFEGPFFYTGLTTTTYKYFSDESNGSAKTDTVNTRNIDDSKTVTITEEQILTYYLHTPINYDANKSYPVVAYCSGDGITLYIDKDTDFGSSITQVDASTYSDNSPFKKFLSSYLYTEGHSNQLYNQTWGGQQLLNSDGTVATHDSSWLPHYGSAESVTNGDDEFVEKWYNLVYTQGKTEYDCFFIFVQPTDRSWYSNSSNTKMATIRNLTKDTTIYSKYTENIKTIANDEMGSTYIARELSANTNEQLLIQLIDSLASQYSIDLTRQYLAGFSLGALFSYDMACHYPDRFACVMTTGLPTCDLTDENCKALINTNFWLFNGSRDLCDANAVWGSQFAQKLNSYSASLGGNGNARCTVINDGHKGIYIAGKGTYVSGTTVESETATYDFMFASVNNNNKTTKTKSEKSGVENLMVSAMTSSTTNEDGSYDLVLISGAPMGNYVEHGFVITTGENKTNNYDRTKLVAVNGMMKTADVILGGETVTLKATDYKSPLLYVYKISNIPSSVESFTVVSFAKTSTSTYYSNSITANISVSGTTVTIKVT